MSAAYDWPLMRGNLRRQDLDAAIRLLRDDDPLLSQGSEVKRFEREWSEWLGCRFSVFVNSGSSANLITLAALRERSGPGDVILPALTWSSDVAAVMHCGFRPVFVDIDPSTLGVNAEQVKDRISADTRAVFLTHVLGFDALEDSLLTTLAGREIPLIEDVCESAGADHRGRRLGTFGIASNFSFYYAHHLTTIEGGMVCTSDRDLASLCRMLRSHGLVRESGDNRLVDEFARRHPDLNPEFTFAVAGYNLRGTEIQAAIGRSQLRDLDARNDQRRQNLATFLAGLDPERYYVEFITDGNSNYAFPVVLRRAEPGSWEAILRMLRDRKIEFRQGLSGGGNQLRQPYLRWLVGPAAHASYPVTEHIHRFSLYVGNYPGLEPERIGRLCEELNRV